MIPLALYQTNEDHQPVIRTIKERCRVCYTCVRDCPAKAIRITEGQAEVVHSRCIGCGNCVQVCSQGAKEIWTATEEAATLLKDESQDVIAIVAPSFPAEYENMSSETFVGLLKSLGFNKVCQVAAGADLVAEEYKKLLESDPQGNWIASTCPAIVSYVEKYHPALSDSLAPIVSPMVATARMVREEYGADQRVIFIGPCPAKKMEASRDGFVDDVDLVLTFKELNMLLEASDLDVAGHDNQGFDPPFPRLGGLFPLVRGLLQTAGLKEDLLVGDIVSADGKNNFAQAIHEFETGSMDSRLLDILCCKGCIMGAGMTSCEPSFKRQALVSKFVRQQVDEYGELPVVEHDIELRTAFEMDDTRLALPSEGEIADILRNMGKYKPGDELDCGTCGYKTCREHAIAIHKGLAETEMCLPHTIDRLKSSLHELNRSNDQLADTKVALVNAEKLASMGQLSAGIAHEINNPLGVILLYSQLMLENLEADSEQAQDLTTIVEQAERCKGIVSGLLNFARKNEVVRRPTNLEDLIRQTMKVTVVPKGVAVFQNFNMEDPMADLDGDQIVQVLTNLINNAVEAMAGEGTITIRTFGRKSDVGFELQDNGPGIPKEHLKKVFEPFFTTKAIGKGTGLGLAVIYGIIKMHHGRVSVRSNTDPNLDVTGTTFIVTLPRRME